jgi:outer membrane protein assembly factor BamE (lipoprotein component of BamABCDE complex)
MPGRLQYLRFAIGLISSLAVFTVACSYGKGPINVVAGRQFPVDLAAKLSPGMTAGEIRTLLGEPFALSRSGDTETWRYTYETKQQEDIKLLWLIPIPSEEHRGRSTATLVFRNGRLAEKVVEN